MKYSLPLFISKKSILSILYQLFSGKLISDVYYREKYEEGLEQVKELSKDLQTV